MNQTYGNIASLQGFGEGKFKIERIQFAAERQKWRFRSNVYRKIISNLWIRRFKGTTAGYGSSAWCLHSWWLSSSSCLWDVQSSDWISNHWLATCCEMLEALTTMLSFYWQRAMNVLSVCADDSFVTSCISNMDCESSIDVGLAASIYNSGGGSIIRLSI